VVKVVVVLEEMLMMRMTEHLDLLEEAWWSHRLWERGAGQL
jgi:hypothetical protein